MGKKHKQQKKSGAPEKAVDAPLLWQNGLTHFQQGNYPKAAAEWQKIPAPLRSPQISAALAETYFRKALGIYQQSGFEPGKKFSANRFRARPRHQFATR
jgi:hypothetical protein